MKMVCRILAPTHHRGIIFVFCPDIAQGLFLAGILLVSAVPCRVHRLFALRFRRVRARSRNPMLAQA